MYVCACVHNCRLFGEEGYLNNKQQPARGSLGSVEYNSQQQQAGAPSPSLPPSTWLSNKQSQYKQEQADVVGSTDDALLASSDVRRPAPTPTRTPAPTATGAGAAVGSSSTKAKAAAAADPDYDPLHDNLSASEKEAEQLSALSRVIQQQQDTITKQVGPTN